MTIAQALLKTWKSEKEKDIPQDKVAPLDYFLEYQYKERYVKLCLRIGIEPLNFGAWLRKDVNEVR